MWRVGDGESIRIWRDNWLPRHYGLKPIGSMRRCRLRRVSHLIDQSSNCWDEAALRRFFHPCDVDEIMRIKIPSTPRPDWFAWNYEKTGVFTVRSAYRVALRGKYEAGYISSSSNADGERTIWKHIWKARVPSKVRVFAWKVATNGLPTNANRKYRHLTHDSRCELCGHDTEDAFHTLIVCPHARALRCELRQHADLPAEGHLRNVGPEWLLAILSRYGSDLCSNFLMVLWRCWTVRNGAVQAGEGISITGSVNFLRRYIDSLNEIRQQADGKDDRGKQKRSIRQLSTLPAANPKEDRRWTPPEDQALKVNVDGAFIRETGKAAIGLIVRDSLGNPLLTAWRSLHWCHDAEEVEAMACLEGLRAAARWTDRVIILESDCSTVVGKLREEVLDRSLVGPVTCDALEASKDLMAVRFVKISREQNKVAHELAHLALRTTENRVSLEDIPDCIQPLVRSERSL
jgi:ribonuclease HI